MSTLEERLGLAGRTCWVAGAGGGGIGTAVARALADAGAHVLALDRDEAALAPSLERAADLKGTIEPIVVDAMDRSAVEALVETKRREGALPHGLVNVIGGLGLDEFGSIVDTDDATFDAVLTRNTRAAWLVSQRVAEAVIAEGRRASFVHVASIVALEAMPFGATYAMAKAALLSLARTQALEWGGSDVRVNTVAAGTIRTPRAGATDPELDRRVLPLGRRGTPDDIAGAALFLLSDLAAWITGQVIAVDGGASIKPAYLDDDGLPVFVTDEALRARLR